MNLRLAVLPIFFLMAAPLCFAGAFGFKPQMTKQAAIAQLGVSAIVEQLPTRNGSKLVFNNAPEPSGDFILYVCFFDHHDKLYGVVAVSPVAATLANAENLGFEFAGQQRSLKTKYGPAHASNSDRSATMTIDDPNGVEDLWDEGNPQSKQEHIREIILKTDVDNANHTTLTLEYDFDLPLS